MADQSINFRIGSTFSGEGFKNAQAAVKDVNGKVGAGARAFGELTKALGEAEGAMGKAMKATTGMINAFVQGGVVGVAFAGTLELINRCYAEAKDKAEAALEAANNMAAQVKVAFNKALADRMTDITKELKNITGEFDRVNSQALAFRTAMNGLKASQGGAHIVNLEVEKYNAMMAAVTDGEKANVEATYNLKIAKEKEAAAIASSRQQVSEATVARKNGEDRINKILEKRAKVEQEIAELSEMKDAAEYSEHRRKYSEQIKKLTEIQEQLGKDIEDQREKNKVLRVAEEKAKWDLASASEKAALETKKAQDAIKAVQDKAKELANAAASAAAEKERQADLARQEKDLKIEAAMLQKDANDAAKDVAEAQRAYAEALAAYEENFARNKIEEGVRATAGERMQAGQLGSIVGEVTKHAVDKAMANGEVRTVRDAMKFERQTAREAKLETQRREKEMNQEQQKFERLSKMSEKAMSKQDKDWLQKFNAIKEAAEKQKKDIEDRKRDLEMAKQREIDNARNLAAIKSKLDALGLK